jgi:hypothetical protein
MRASRAFGASLFAAALLLGGTAWTQQPAPPLFPLPGPSPLPAPPLAVNPSAPLLFHVSR